MAALPEPEICHSEAGLPGFEFSQGIGLATGTSHGPAALAGCDAVGAAELNIADSRRLTTISGNNSCLVRIMARLTFRRAICPRGSRSRTLRPAGRLPVDYLFSRRSKIEVPFRSRRSGRGAEDDVDPV